MLVRIDDGLLQLNLPLRRVTDTREFVTAASGAELLPVLSEQITVVLPRVSTAGMRRMMA